MSAWPLTPIRDAISSVGVAEVQDSQIVALHPNRLVYGAAQDAIAGNRSAVVQLRDSFHIVTGFAEMWNPCASGDCACACVIGGQAQLHVSTVAFHEPLKVAN